jgi:hypothetical protein
VAELGGSPVEEKEGFNAPKKDQQICEEALPSFKREHSIE